MTSDRMSLEEFRKLSAQREAKFKKSKRRSEPSKKADGTSRKKPTQWESGEQEALFVKLNGEKQRKSILAPVYDAIYHVPNGGFRDFKTSKDMKKQGVRKGVSDLVLPIGRGGYFGLYIEFKAARPHNSDISEEQVDWLELVEREGYAATLAVGKDEAIEILLNYMSMPPTCKKAIQVDLGGTDWRLKRGSSKGK